MIFLYLWLSCPLENIRRLGLSPRRAQPSPATSATAGSAPVRSWRSVLCLTSSCSPLVSVFSRCRSPMSMPATGF